MQRTRETTLMRTPIWISSLTLVILAGMAPPVFGGKVKAFPDPKTDFTQFKTYSWLPPRVLTKVGIDENHPGAPTLKEVVNQQLVKKGLKEVATGADLQVQAYVLTESSPQLEAIIFTASPVAQNDIWVLGAPIATMGRYNKEGSLYINLINARTKKSAWLAMSSDSLPNRTLKPDEIRSKLDSAATKIFKKYPVKTK